MATVEQLQQDRESLKSELALLNDECQKLRSEKATFSAAILEAVRKSGISPGSSQSAPQLLVLLDQMATTLASVRKRQSGSDD